MSVAYLNSNYLLLSRLIIYISVNDVVLEDVLGLEDVLEDRFVKSLASTALSLALASALLGLGFCAVLGSRTRYL